MAVDTNTNKVSLVGMCVFKPNEFCCSHLGTKEMLKKVDGNQTSFNVIYFGATSCNMVDSTMLDDVASALMETVATVVQMYEFSHIHFHLISSTATLPKPAPSWLDSSIGRALHRYRRGHGFESRSSLTFFSGFLFASQLFKLRITAMIIHLFIRFLHGLRRTRFAKYRSSNLETLHFGIYFSFSLSHANRNLTGVVFDIFNSTRLFIIFVSFYFPKYSKPSHV